jgi:hypothetical protein
MEACSKKAASPIKERRLAVWPDRWCYCAANPIQEPFQQSAAEVYSTRQLLRCFCGCKELIHSCDTDVERTNTEEEVTGLLDKLLGPLSTEARRGSNPRCSVPVVPLR